MTDRQYTKDIDGVRQQLREQANQLGYGEVEKMVEDEREHFKIEQDRKRSQGL